MTVDFKTLLSILPHVTSANHPILLRGRHGIGKSSVVYQFAESLDLPVVERRASQMTEGDLLGLPKVDGGVTTFCPPDWLDRACNEAVILFLDEVDRATLEVRQGIFELCDSRKLAGNVLHPETLIFAAVNGGEHGAQYQGGEMDPAELDRWTVFDVEPSVEDWLKWANGKVDGILWDFVNMNRAHLEHIGDFEPNKVYPSRRSWVRLNDTSVPADVFGEEGDRDLLFNLAPAFVGFEAAVSIRDFVEKYEWQVTIADILDKGDLSKTVKWGINDHAAMIEKFEASEVFKEDLTETQISNLAEYFVALPSEVAMKLWSVLGDTDNINNVVALHKADTKEGTRVSEHLVEILGGAQ